MKLGKYYNRPSGIKTVPKFIPFSALKATISAMLMTMYSKVHPFLTISSLIKVMFGLVYKALSNTLLNYI